MRLKIVRIIENIKCLCKQKQFLLKKEKQKKTNARHLLLLFNTVCSSFDFSTTDRSKSGCNVYNLKPIYNAYTYRGAVDKFAIECHLENCHWTVKMLYAQILHIAFK